VALDEAHLVAAARYVALNPVRAKLVARAQEHSVFRRSGNRFAAENASKENWAWSSARAHLAGRDDGLVRVAPLIERVGRFAELLGMETDLALFAALRDAESTGRPLGSVAFVAELEQLTGRRLQRRAAGRKATERTQQLELGIGEIGKVSP
jgi:putative transposase